MSPYDEGRAAAASGVTENPYAEGTYPYAEWSRGHGASCDGTSGIWKQEHVGFRLTADP